MRADIERQGVKPLEAHCSCKPYSAAFFQISSAVSGILALVSVSSASYKKVKANLFSSMLSCSCKFFVWYDKFSYILIIRLILPDSNVVCRFFEWGIVLEKVTVDFTI